MCNRPAAVQSAEQTLSSNSEVAVGPWKPQQPSSAVCRKRRAVSSQLHGAANQRGEQRPSATNAPHSGPRSTHAGTRKREEESRRSGSLCSASRAARPADARSSCSPWLAEGPRLRDHRHGSILSKVLHGLISVPPTRSCVVPGATVRGIQSFIKADLCLNTNISFTFMLCKLLFQKLHL